MKLLLVVLDGLGDIRSEKFGNNTPLDNDRLTSLNSLASKGMNGLVYVTPGIAPESNSAVLSLLGYPPEMHGGRGPLEAIGTGVDFKDGMLGLRCNFATCEGDNLVDRRVGRDLTNEECAALAESINDKVRLSGGNFIFKPSVAHRAVLIISSDQELSANISNTDPAYRMRDGIAEALKDYPKKVMESTAFNHESRLGAELLNEFTRKSRDVLENHEVNFSREKEGKLKANVILSRDAGNEVPKLYNISKKYDKRWAILADMPLEIGIGRLCGMDVIDLPLPTFTKEDYPERVEKTISAMEDHECLYIHLKGPDIFGHDGDFEGKKKSIEEIDEFFFSPLLEKIDLKDTILVVTGDHATPCVNKSHSADPVPILIAGGEIKPDKVQRFSETDAKEGSLGILKGIEVMGELMRIYCKNDILPK